MDIFLSIKDFYKIMIIIIIVSILVLYKNTKSKR